MPSKFASLIAAFVLFANQPPAAQAFVVAPPGTVQALMDCPDRKMFNSDSRDAPAIIASRLSGEGARLVFSTCQDADGNTHYFVRAPRSNRNGVCRAFEEQIFPATASDRVRIEVTYGNMAGERYVALKGWTRSIPQGWGALKYASQAQEYGFLTDSDCPRGDDARYMALTNVSDDVLKSFQGAWSRISASRQSLEAATAKLPTVWTVIEHFDTPERQQKLRERAIDGVLAGTEIPRGYRCDGENACSVAFNSFGIDFAPAPSGIVLTKLFQLWRA